MSSSTATSVNTREYTGGCHCKRFRYQFTYAAFENGESTIYDCNCSLCTMVGALSIVGVPDASFEFTSGSRDELSKYEFNKKVYKHCFCPTCGSKLFVAGNGTVTVNARSVDGVDVKKLKLVPFDGASIPIS